MTNAQAGNYDIDHLLQMHGFIFQDIFDWAGQPGTTITFCCQFADEMGFTIKLQPGRHGDG